jgi:hypothetical protein
MVGSSRHSHNREGPIKGEELTGIHEQAVKLD